MKLFNNNCLIALVALSVTSVTAGAQNAFVQHNLVSDIAGLGDHTDKKLTNAWGLVHSSGSPWWVNANGSGFSLVYDGTGAGVPAASPIAVPVAVPAGDQNPATPTGIVFNGTQDFQIAPSKPAAFIFVTEDGTISGWNSGANGGQAVMEVNKSDSAVYKGVGIGQIGATNVIYAANFRQGTVDTFDGNFKPVTLSGTAFQDPNLPAGFAPFNVTSINGAVYVTFAKQDGQKHDDVPGHGLGYIDKFTPDGTLIVRFEHGPWMNAPWGLAVAPGNFGDLSSRVLTANFGSGQIAAFDATSGQFVGMLRGKRKPITIDGLWGLDFGNDGSAGPSNALFFTAGIQDESHGLFGTLTPIPSAKGN
ncbi:MAG TPA: TIGR03118 family protein [Bryobacteraceae bacterium]|nr:TIGR03118 family protein [Bryobacteraceae bacterium]